ncbi:MAG: OmpA family protein, partial [Myxococcota bacterium]
IQNFQPVNGPFGIFSVDSSTSSNHLQFSGGFVLNFASEPLTLVPDDPSLSSEPIVEDQLVGDVVAALGLYDIVEVGLALPIYLVNNAAVGTENLDGATLGDLRLRPKLTVLDAQDGLVGLAFYLQLGFHTGDDEAFASSGSFYARPGVIVDSRIRRLLLSANVTVNLQEQREFGNLDVGSQLLYSGGAEYELVEGTFLIGGELFGSSSFDDFLSSVEESPLEGLVGLKYRTPVGINFETAAGGGLISGYGSPAYRVVFGIRYGVYNNDFDEDGIVNRDDGCPQEPEDRDGFEDEDGCPDRDNDKDGIADADDNCPNDAEDPDGFEDTDGCPDPDNDRDTIADVDDKCPDEAGLPEYEGCPDPDRDKDGIANVDDQCPDEPGVAEYKGCPVPDSDGDGIVDNVDKCPNDPEDIDQFEDQDGCPDGDNDKDKVCDPWIDETIRTQGMSAADAKALRAKFKCTAADACPRRAGLAKHQGCPGPKKVVVTAEKIEIKDTVYFKSLRAEILPKSFELLDEVTETIIAYPRIRQIEIQGHTDITRNHQFCDRLSQARAEAVRTYLIEKGVAAERLTAKGYGKRQPISTAKRVNPENRRVEFHIVAQDRTKVIEVPREIPKGGAPAPSDPP